MPWGAIAGVAAPIIMDMLSKSDAEKASGAQAQSIEQNAAMQKQLMGLFNSPNQNFQTEALANVLHNPDLMGMAGGFARQELIKSILGIGGNETSAIKYAQEEDTAMGNAAAQIAQYVAMMQQLKSDPGSSEEESSQIAGPVFGWRS